MAIDLYMMEGSPPCRVVVLVAKYLGIELNKKHVDFEKREHKSPTFLKMNPQHCMPTIDDNGFYLWESRAIITYLVNQYVPDSDLYPKDPKKRAAIDRLLYFDIGTLYKSTVDAMHGPVFFGKARNVEKEATLKTSLQTLEDFLARTFYVAGEKLSLADISVLVTIEIIKLLGEEIEFDIISSFRNIQAWQKRVKEHLPFFHEVSEPAEKQLKDVIASMKTK